MHPDIQLSITLSDIEEEKQLETMTSTSALNGNATNITSILSPISQLTDPSLEYYQVVRTIDPSQLQFNFKTKPAAVVLGANILKEDTLSVRQQNANIFQEGKIMRGSLKEIKG